MSNIAIIGLGHGGIVAAVKLAKIGHKVEIFEKTSWAWSAMIGTTI